MRLRLISVSAISQTLVFCAAPFAEFLPLPAMLSAFICLALIPLAVFPAFCFTMGALTGTNAGFAPQQALLTGLAFMPAALLHYGSPAPYFAAAYAACSALGMALGCAVRRAGREG